MLMGTLALAMLGVVAALRVYPSELARARATIAIEEGAVAYEKAFDIDYKGEAGRSRPLWEAAYNDFVRASASPIQQILGKLDSAARSAAWNEMEERLKGFETASGWEGPNELLLTAARR